MRVLDYGIYQLFSKLLILVDLEGVAVKGFEKFFEIVLGNHISVVVVHLIKELKKLL